MPSDAVSSYERIALEPAVKASTVTVPRSVEQGGPPPPVRCWYGLEIRFDVPVEGPICLGYAAHFGLGRLEAAGG